MEVEGDWYYRVRCIHSAGEDISSSFTNGVFIERVSLSFKKENKYKENKYKETKN